MLKIAQITDPHLLPPGEKLMGLDVVQRFESVLSHASRFTPDAYFLTGDFCASMPVRNEFEWLADRLKKLDKPYYIVPGNHDDRIMLREALGLPGNGDEPMARRLELSDQVFLLLDTRYAELGEEQLSWLSHNLANSPGAHVVMHHPPLKMGQTFMDDNYALADWRRAAAIMKDRAHPVHVFCGHYHGGRTVVEGNITVHLCPPTSFYIKPDAKVFEQDDLPPAYQQIVWSAAGAMTVTPIYLSESAVVPTD